MNNITLYLKEEVKEEQSNPKVSKSKVRKFKR